MAAKVEKSTELNIPRIGKANAKFYLLGTTAFLCNSMQAKAKREFLLPAGRRRSAADRALSLKHDPLAEYRGSIHRVKDPAAPTLLGIPGTAFKGALGTAALDLPGAKKAEINRLVWVKDEYAFLWGIPELHQAIVRSADMARTPDLRTRAAVREWCTEITVEWVTPKMNANSVLNLLFAGGLTCGVGDGRQEKGKLSHGQFTVVGKGTPEWEDFLRIQETGGRAAQEEALRNPICFDDDTEEMMTWFSDELERRGQSGAVAEYDEEDELEAA